MYDNEYPNGTGTSEQGIPKQGTPQRETPLRGEENDRPGRYYPIYDAVDDYNNYGGSPSGSNQNDHKPGKEKSGFGKRLAAAIVLGLFFGVCAGIGFFSIGFATGKTREVKESVTVSEEQAVTIETPEAEEETGTQEATENGGIVSQEKTPEIAPSKPILSESGSVTAVVTDVTGIVEQVMPAMVSILNNYTERTSYFGQTYTQQEQASGSGIIIGENDTELLLVTNYHVIEQADSLEVTFANEKTAEAVVKGTDETMDLAVIAIPLTELDRDTADSIAIATLGDSDALSIGEPAIAIGNALGYGQSVTTGVVSALNRMLEAADGTSSGPFIQTDAAINPGNSGGALLNIKGELIGINSNKIGGSKIEGMGYAIPISAAKPILSDLMSRETRFKVAAENRGYLGITGINITQVEAQMYGMPQGVYINQVLENGAAARAGLKKGDIIVKIGDQDIKSMDELEAELEYYEAGSEVTFIVMQIRDGDYAQTRIRVVLGTKP